MGTEDRYASIGPEERGKLLDVGEPSTEETVEQYDAIQEIPQQDVTDEMLRNDVGNPNSWLVYNKGLEQTGFSPADRLHTDNVDSLERAYTLDTESAGLQTNPIVVPSDPPIMYYTVQGAWKVHAVNARTGEKFWTFQAGLPENVKDLDLPVNRGVGVWKDKVYFATPEPAIVAVDRYTGEKQWSTNLKVDGQVDYRLFLTQAPLLHEGRVFVGQSSDYATWTTVSSLDAETGDIVWQKRTAPENEWVGETWKYASAAAWMSPTLDPKSNTVLFPVGNPDPMFNGVVRPGPNQYSNAIMALDAGSGEMKWVTQISPHDVWDYDVHATPTVFDMEVGGEQRRVLATIWKAGWFYILDMESGQLIERTEPFARQGGGFLRLPPAGEENGKPMYPAIPGATEWPPDAFSLQTGLLYVGACNYGQEVWYNPDWAYKDYERESFAYGGGTRPIEGDENTVEVVALNPASGRIAWQHEIDDVDPNWPPTRLFTGGTTATAGNLVFHSSSGGHLYALDAESGEQLWKDDTGNRITAAPVVWDDPNEEKQYVSIAAGPQIVTYESG